MKAHKKESNIVLTVASIVAVCWLGLLFISLLTLAVDPLLMPNLGQLGDVFGMLNTLFSGLAMTGAIYAVILQGKELREQQEITNQNLNKERFNSRPIFEAYVSYHPHHEECEQYYLTFRNVGHTIQEFYGEVLGENDLSFYAAFYNRKSESFGGYIKNCEPKLITVSYITEIGERFFCTFHISIPEHEKEHERGIDAICRLNSFSRDVDIDMSKPGISGKPLAFVEQ